MTTTPVRQPVPLPPRLTEQGRVPMARRRTATDIELAALVSAAESLAVRQRVDRLLTTSVRISDAGPAPPVTRLRHLNLQQIGGLEVSGGPMQLSNGLSQPDAVFVFALAAGRCTLMSGELRAELRGGQFVVMRGDRTVVVRHHLPFQVRGTRLPSAQLARELPGWEAAELLPLDGGAGPGALLMGLQEQLLAQGEALTSRSADAFAQTLACLLADALAAVLPATERRPDSQAEHHLRRIRSYVRQHLADPALDVAAVARGVALSPSHVHRLFAGEPQSLAAWVLAERLDACRQALAGEPGRPRSVTEVALSWGFQDLAHFSRSFKRRFGLSPSAARRLETPPLGPDAGAAQAATGISR